MLTPELRKAWAKCASPVIRRTFSACPSKAVPTFLFRTAAAHRVPASLSELDLPMRRYFDEHDVDYIFWSAKEAAEEEGARAVGTA